MSRLTIRWTIRALRRLDQIGEHIAQDNPDAAARVVSRLASSVELLADQPAMGRIGRLKGTRELVFADIPYIIPYRVVGDALEILTILHAAQEWPKAL